MHTHIIFFSKKYHIPKIFMKHYFCLIILLLWINDKNDQFKCSL